MIKIKKNLPMNPVAAKMLSFQAVSKCYNSARCVITIFCAAGRHESVYGYHENTQYEVRCYRNCNT